MSKRFIILTLHPSGELVAVPAQNIILVERSMDGSRDYYSTITVEGNGTTYCEKIDIHEGFHRVLKLIDDN